VIDWIVEVGWLVCVGVECQVNRKDDSRINLYDEESNATDDCAEGDRYGQAP
jgi:hypothetical protein